MRGSPTRRKNRALSSCSLNLSWSSVITAWPNRNFLLDMTSSEEPAVLSPGAPARDGGRRGGGMVGGGEERAGRAILMQSKSFNDVEALGDSQYSLRSVTFSPYRRPYFSGALLFHRLLRRYLSFPPVPAHRGSHSSPLESSPADPCRANSALRYKTSRIVGVVLYKRRAVKAVSRRRRAGRRTDRLRRKRKKRAIPAGLRELPARMDISRFLPFLSPIDRRSREGAATYRVTQPREICTR